MSAENLSAGDFLEVDYSGTVKASGELFDTTSAEVGKKKGLDPSAKYGSVIICLGEGHMLKGLEKALVGRAYGKLSVTVSADDGFGRKDPKLIRMIPTSNFKSHEVNPFPGLRVNVDGYLGIIKTVSGGRALVDFNHPLSGHELNYDIEVKRIVIDTNEKVNSLMRFFFHDAKVSIADSKATVELGMDVHQQLKDKVKVDVLRLVPEIKELGFVVKKSETNSS